MLRRREVWVLSLTGRSEHYQVDGLYPEIRRSGVAFLPRPHPQRWLEVE